jgi:hypothetical protein
VQIRVADPAGLDGDENLSRPWVGDDDRPHLDGCAPLDSDYGTDLMGHDTLLCCCAVHDVLRDEEHSGNATERPSRGAS